MAQFLDRILGFMPNNSILWTAMLTTLFAFVVQSLHNWFQSMIILPWQRKSNQQRRMEILQGSSRKPNHNKN